MTKAELLSIRLNDLQFEFKQVDNQIKYKQNLLSPPQIRVYRKLRTKLRKQIAEIKIKLDLLQA